MAVAVFRPLECNTIRTEYTANLWPGVGHRDLGLGGSCVVRKVTLLTRSRIETFGLEADVYDNFFS